MLWMQASSSIMSEEAIFDQQKQAEEDKLVLLEQDEADAQYRDKNKSKRSGSARLVPIPARGSPTQGIHTPLQSSISSTMTASSASAMSASSLSSSNPSIPSAVAQFKRSDTLQLDSPAARALSRSRNLTVNTQHSINSLRDRYLLSLLCNTSLEQPLSSFGLRGHLDVANRESI
jgi:hypothetical protein